MVETHIIGLREGDKVEISSNVNFTEKSYDVVSLPGNFHIRYQNNLLHVWEGEKNYTHFSDITGCWSFYPGKGEHVDATFQTKDGHHKIHIKTLDDLKKIQIEYH